MFRGASKVTLDAKGRMAIPTRHRQAIHDGCEGQMMFSVDRDYCLMLYPMPVWEEIERKLVKLPSLNRKARRLQRLMIGYASDVVLDSHGRILVSKELREFAGIKKAAMLIGQGNKFELWDEERWADRCDAWMSESQSDEGDLPAELESLSF